jgi:uncharacterized protein YkwD
VIFPPTTVSRSAVLAVLILLIAVSTASARSRTASRSEQSLLDAINLAREHYHLRPLVRDNRLDRAAEKHSDDMIRRRYFGHTTTLAKLPGNVVGENLAWCSGKVRAWTIVEAWLRSPEHRENLLRPGFRRIGIGIAIGRLGGAPQSRVVTVDFSGT